MTTTATAAGGPGIHAPAAVAARLTDVTQHFGEASRPPVLEHIDLTVEPGEFVCLLGASGCGKSTLLSLIAGLDKPVAGEVEVPGGRPALMFQEPALYPWLSAGANVELALRLRGVARKERKVRGRAAAGARASRGRRSQARARAVGRHAPARGPGPGARAGGRPAAHGRALRRARRDHARRAARGAHPHLGRDGSCRHLRDPQRPRGGPARASASSCSRHDPVGSCGSGAWTSRSPDASRTTTCPSSALRSPSTCGRRSRAMATETHEPVTTRGPVRERARRRPGRPRDPDRHRPTLVPAGDLALGVAGAGRAGVDRRRLAGRVLARAQAAVRAAEPRPTCGRPC